MHSVLGNRIALYREPAWHTLGTVIFDRVPATEALTIAKGDITITTIQPVLRGPWGDIEDSRHAVIVREPLPEDEKEYPTGRPLGIAGSDYTVLSNRRIAELLDPLTERYPVNTVGVLDDGATIFFCLDSGTSQVAGEEVSRHFLVSDKRDGRNSLRMAYVPVRVVCANTLSLSLSQAVVNLGIAHTRHIEADASFRIQVQQNMVTAADKIDGLLNKLGEFTISDEEFRSVLLSAYPQPTRPRRLRQLDIYGQELVLSAEEVLKVAGQERYRQEDLRWQRANEWALICRAAVTELAQKIDDEFPAIAKTGWARFNAVTEWESHRRNTQGGGAAKATARNLLFGNATNTVTTAYRELAAIGSK